MGFPSRARRCITWQTPPLLETDSTECECPAATVESNIEELSPSHCPIAGDLFRRLYPSYDPERNKEMFNMLYTQPTNSETTVVALRLPKKRFTAGWPIRRCDSLLTDTFTHTRGHTHTQAHTVSCQISHKCPFLKEICIMHDSWHWYGWALTAAQQISTALPRLPTNQRAREHKIPANTLIFA